MKRKHMNHMQDIIRRIQLGESERQIARDMQISRQTVHKYQAIAKEQGYLEKGRAQPSEAELQEALGRSTSSQAGLDGGAIPGSHSGLVETRGGDDGPSGCG